MNIFGIGTLEIVFVLIIGILVLGPDGMIESGRKLGKFMRSIVHSDWWQNIRKGVSEIQHLPQRLMREAELEELNELRELTKNSFPSIGSKDLISSSSWGGNLTPKSKSEEQSTKVPEQQINEEKKPKEAEE